MLNVNVCPVNVKMGVSLNAMVMKRLIENGGGFRMRGI